jgi:hypothetical protein
MLTCLALIDAPRVLSLEDGLGCLIVDLAATLFARLVQGCTGTGLRTMSQK